MSENVNVLKLKVVELILTHSHKTGKSLEESFHDVLCMYRKVFPRALDKELSQEEAIKS